jgi:metal-responsive CopG/Arc/MetJ family transcriptional regulator
MATVNFSVPQDIKEAFDKTFARQNKSAVLADLMRQAVEERRRRKRVAKAIDKILTLRKQMRPVDDRTISSARRQGRP